MQTVSSLAERLDMTAEEAVEKLRYMLFDVDGVESVISDEECDLLIDVDDDDSVAEEVREKKLQEQEKAKKRNERLRNAAKKAAAKRKEKAAAKKKSPAKKKKAAAKPKAEILPEEEGEKKEEAAEEPAPAAEILPGEDAAAVAEQPVLEEAPAAEILPSEEEAPKEEVEEKPDEPPKPSITIGRAIERDKGGVQVVRADGRAVEAPEAEIIEEESAEPATEEEDEDDSLVAEAERREEEELRRQSRHKPQVTPDPAVVAEVKRKALERMQEKMKRKQQRAGAAAPEGVHPSAPAKVPARPGRTGKTARKRQKKAERARQEEDRRREAAAAVREIQAGGAGKKRRKKRDRDEIGDGLDAAYVSPTVIEVDESISVEDLAQQIDVETNELILDLMDLNVLANKNQMLDIGLVRQVAEPRGFEVRSAIPEEEEVLQEEPDNPEDLKHRAPVITVMGHVDHGKTTLLDRIRSANVAEGEVGGITQHIAAYEAMVGDGRVVFLDTPGHEAFTQMRARGAQCTDVVVLVVAADDGIMPQTVEAIDHAKAAEVPIVVAVNKCDKPDAQPDRIRQELTRFDLLSEEWGGKTIVKDISAKSGEGVDELMELLALEAELLELKANPNKPARGVVVESEISRGQGPVAWVLVQSGTLKIGDIYVAGKAHGRVRAMMNSRGENLDTAGPSTPVLVMGFSEPPDAGDHFAVVPDERVARAISAKRSDIEKQKSGQVKHITLEDFHERMKAGERAELNVLLKADVQGSVDVLSSSLGKLGNEEVSVSIVHSGVGGINESDVLLASASDAVVIGFHVTANPRAQKLAEQEGVDIHTYQVIYEAIDEVRKALEGMLKPESREVVTGHAEIRQVFRSSAIGNIAGCYVLDGEINRGGRIRVVRNDVIAYDGAIGTLRRAKDDVRDVQTGFECGIKIENYDDIQEGDILEGYRIESVAKTLA